MPLPVPAALHHTCFLVRDLESTAQRLSDALGIGPWHVWTITPAESKVHGQPTPCSFRIALTAVGGGNFELVSPHGGRSGFEEWLTEHGEGFHHTCLMYSSLEDLRAAKAELLRQGRELIQEGGSGDVFDFGYFRFPEIGSLVEVLYLDPARLPPPDKVIGASTT